MTYTQDTRSIGIETPLGKDVFLLLSVEGEEAISELFNFKVELTSGRMNITPKEVIGLSVNIWIKLHDGSKHYYNGYINRFSLGAKQAATHRSYHAEVVPWLWFHEQNRAYRIFQNKTAVEVIENLLTEIQIPHYQINCQRTHLPLAYCVQYQESDMAFIIRIAKHYGLFFFFTHAQNTHTLIVSDDVTAYPNCAEYSAVQSSATTTSGRIIKWNHHYEYVTDVWSQTDFNFETPNNNLLTNSQKIVDLTTIENISKYNHPGKYHTSTEGQSLTDLRMKEDEERFDTVIAKGNYRSFCSGAKFKMTQHDITHEEGKEYVITRLSFFAKERSYFVRRARSFIYYNKFTAIPSSLTCHINKEIVNPMVLGPQTAMVTGPTGKKIYSDKYGRVKIKFHWDRRGSATNADNRSCWVRVSQNWAGKTTAEGVRWGEMSLPHVGDEVIVSFLEGDPDRPIITGRVYNAFSRPPEIISDQDINYDPDNPANITANLEKRIIRDDAGNEFIMNAKTGERQIRIASPDSAALILGHGAPEENDEGEIVAGNFRAISGNVGDKFEFGLGSAYSGSIGNDFEFRGGMKTEIYVGADIELKLAKSTALHFGTQYEYSLGAKFERHDGPVIEHSKGPQVNETTMDILSRATKDHIIAAGDSICLAANCEELNSSTSRSLINADGKGLSLSIGGAYNAPAAPITGELNTWYEKTPAQQQLTAKAKAIKGLVIASFIIVIVGQILTAIAAGVNAALSKNDSIVGKSIAIGLGTAVTLVSVVTVGIMNLVIIGLSADENKDSAIENITPQKDSVDSLIDLNPTNGIEIRSKEKAVKLISGTSSDTDAAQLKLDDKFSKMSINKSEIWLRKSTGSISIDTQSTAGTKGQIQIMAKGDLLLKSAKEIKVNSTAFTACKNFKVLS